VLVPPLREVTETSSGSSIKTMSAGRDDIVKVINLLSSDGITMTVSRLGVRSEDLVQSTASHETSRRAAAKLCMALSEDLVLCFNPCFLERLEL
jgi:hypothetical protein